MEWHLFRRAYVEKENFIGFLFLGVTQNERSFVGAVGEVTPSSVTLINGPDRETLYFDRHPGMRWTKISPPGGVTFGIGSARLPLE